MANVKQLRLRIKSIKSTKKITKAMQMVSAAKLRKSRIALEGSGIYRGAVEAAFQKVLAVDQDLSSLAKIALGIESHSKVKLLVLIGSDRGLCGSFNQAIFRILKADITKLNNADIPFKIIAIGKKPTQFVNIYYPQHVIEVYNNSEFRDQNFSVLSKNIINMLTTQIAENKIGSCDVYFTEFKNTVTQIATVKELVPLKITKTKTEQNTICGVEGETLVENLIEMYIIAQIQYALLESRASEEASRTTAMDNATRNAEEMIDKLTLVMNRNRQAMITKELIEIISGAEAV